MNFLTILFLVCLILFIYFFVKRIIEKNKQEQKQKVSELLHDLKTPLTSILGYVELLKSAERTPETQEEFLGIIEFEAEKLLQLLGSGLSENTNNNNNKNKELKSSTNCAKVISLICRGLSPDAKKKNISLNYDCDPDLYVDFVENKLWRVISNLIENSIKYNKPGGTVHISAKNDSDYIIIECEDTGIGIKPEHVPKVFKKGFRGEKKIPGFGLGLSIVHDIVSNNGGFMQLESEYGVGTKFTLKLRKAQEKVEVVKAESPISC